MPSVKTLILSLAGLIAVSFIANEAWYWYEDGRFIEETDNAYVKADSIAIRPEISARIKAVLVHENQHVKAGTVMIQLDEGDYLAQVSEAEAQLAVGRAAIANAKAQIDLQDKTIAEAQASIDAANAELNRSELELNRFKVLEKQSFDSRQQVQNAEAAMLVAKAQVDQAIASKAAAEQMIDVLNVQFDSAKAQLNVLVAQRDYARNQLEKTRIVAPVDGIVGNLGARLGSAAQPAQTLLYVVPLPDVYVVANFKETQIGNMSAGQPVTLHVDAAPDIQFTGVVESLAPASGTEFSLLPADNATGNFNKIVQRVPVRIRVTGPEASLPLLRPGLSVVPGVDTRTFHKQISYLMESDTPYNSSLTSLQ